MIPSNFSKYGILLVTHTFTRHKINVCHRSRVIKGVFSSNDHSSYHTLLPQNHDQ